MIFRNLDRNGDWVYGNGVQAYLTGQKAIEKDVKTFLLLWTGNCFWALQAGINWRQYLDRGQQPALLAGLQTGILARYGVMGINQLDAGLDRATRGFFVKYDLATIYTQSFQDSITVGAPSA
jgi:hypothetical protein